MTKFKLEVSKVKRMTTECFIQTLTLSFCAYYHSKIISKHPSVFVQGQPGIGKSQAILQIADNLEKSLNKKVVVNDIRLLLFNPVDLRGIPVADIEKKVAIWLTPEVFNFDTSEDIINILFLDELTAAPSSLQAAAYQIALDRRLGEHKIPNNTFIIAAGNRLSDHAIAYEMPTPLRNRFMHFELELDFPGWLNWAKNKNIHPEIISFLSENPDKFSTSNFETSSNIIVTPRSWEFLSNILYTLGGKLEDRENYIASIIGNSLTSLMLNDVKITPIEDILEGKVVDQPTTMSELQRINDILESQLISYAKNKTYINNILSYLLQIPMDYAIRIFREIVKLEIVEFDITEIDSYQEFLKKLNDYDE